METGGVIEGTSVEVTSTNNDTTRLGSNATTIFASGSADPTGKGKEAIGCGGKMLIDMQKRKKIFIMAQNPGLECYGTGYLSDLDDLKIKVCTRRKKSTQSFELVSGRRLSYA